MIFHNRLFVMIFFTTVFLLIVFEELPSHHPSHQRFLYLSFIGANLHFRIRTPLRAVQIRKWRRLFRAFKGLEPKHRFLSI